MYDKISNTSPIKSCVFYHLRHIIVQLSYFRLLQFIRQFIFWRAWRHIGKAWEQKTAENVFMCICWVKQEFRPLTIGRVAERRQRDTWNFRNAFHVPFSLPLLKFKWYSCKISPSLHNIYMFDESRADIGNVWQKNVCRIKPATHVEMY